MAQSEWRKVTIAVRVTPTEKAALDWSKREEGTDISENAYRMMKRGNLDKLVEKFLFATNASDESQTAS